MERKFVAKNLAVKSWEDIEKYFNDLFQRNINSKEELINWLSDRSELESILEEDLAWRYIKMNCDTEDEKLSEAFNFFVTEIEPKISEQSNLLDKKYLEIPYHKELNSIDFEIITRYIKTDIELFRKENIPIFAELQKEEQEFGRINGAMIIEYDGKEYTLQQASNFLKDLNRGVRKEIYELTNKRRLKDADKLNDILSSLIQKRHKLAKNAGFENFRNYKHKSLGRFDYSIEDCFTFHKSIKEAVTPILSIIQKERKQQLEYSKLLPYDLDVDAENKPPLKPFKKADELINIAIKIFKRIRPKYGDFLTIMKENGYLDLDSRKGKAPGGFNYPLYESSIPFIFMNASGNLRDVETMIHEGGHAIHSFLTADLPLVYNKQFPSEVAELASMTMELISMDYWDEFFKDEDELKRAKRSQLEGVIQVLPWVATIDKFQHWIYENPDHTNEERTNNWLEIFEEFSSDIVDWSGYDEYKKNVWQKQLHIFEVPFYYIEYGISQLGAIAIWRNFKQNKEVALNNYENAMKLGYTKTIPEIYKAAGIKFDFSIEYIKELMEFVKEELKKLNNN
jgi:oligoendopeptidase F